MAAWWRRLAARRARAADATDQDERWVVVDTETSGLDPRTDRLLAIGAVAVGPDGIRLGDSFECALRTEGVGSASNVEVHGIGHEAQRGGALPAVAVPAFAAWLDGAPCIGFHAGFDRTVLTRAFAESAAGPVPSRWLDLEPLAAALLPSAGGRSLDDWLVVFAIDVGQRHNAAADALASAELLLHLQAHAVREGVRGFEGLVRLARQGRWLAPGR